MKTINLIGLRETYIFMVVGKLPITKIDEYDNIIKEDFTIEELVEYIDLCFEFITKFYWEDPLNELNIRLFR